MKDVLQLMFAIVIVLALHRSEVQSEDYPGLQLLVSQHGLDHAAGMGVDELMDAVQKLQLPDDDDISNLHVTDVTKPSYNVDANSGVLRLTLSNAALSLYADWRHVADAWLFKIRTSGSLTCSVSDVSISVSVTMGMDASGHPTISTADCSCSIPNLSLKLSGSVAAWIANLFVGLFKNKIRRKMEGKICDAATKVINGKVNEQLTSLPLEMPVAKDYMIDYRCLSAPSLENGYLLTKHKALFYNREFPGNPPVQAEPIPTTLTADKMVTICISDYVPKTMGYAVFSAGILTYTLTQNNLPAEFSGFLSTTCSPDSNCVGNQIKGLPDMYPNTSVEVTIAANKPPTTVISPSQIQVTFSGTITGRVPPSEDEFFPEFLKIALLLQVNIVVAMDQNLLKVTVTSITPTVKAVSSSVGSIPKADVTQTIETLCNALMMPALNERGQEGFPVPAIKDTEFVDTSVTLEDHYISLSANVRLKQ